MAIAAKRTLASLRAFIRGGTTRFSDAESAIIEYAIAALPIADQEILREQLDALRLVQRPHPGRLTIAYFHRPETLRTLPYPGYEHCLARVTYKTKGKSRTSSLVLTDGRLMTIERNVPIRLDEIEALTRIALHPARFRSVTAEIDHEEHGDMA